MTKVYQASDIGKVRENNEDSLAIFPPEIYMVADGMGGRAGGEVASGLAVKPYRPRQPSARSTKRSFDRR